MAEPAVQPAAQPAAGERRRRRDLAAALILGACCLGALIAFAAGIGPIADAGLDTRLAEAWRTFGYLIFAVLFAALALRPRALPGIWEVCILHKLAMAVLAIADRDAEDAGAIALSDATLAVALLVAYALAGWRAWSRPAPAG